MTTQLKFTDHNRFFNECKYIYPVLSRRAQGVSLGINLNLNNTCNWKCIYCQVEGLNRGVPRPVNLSQLEQELTKMLEWIIHGDFLIDFAPENLRRLNDICIAGNGEPTLSPNFTEVCQTIEKLRSKFNITTEVKTILISNGSQVNNSKIRQGLRIIDQNNGEIWFKIDRINSQSILETNQIHLSKNLISKNLITASQQCKVLIQSCWFSNNGVFPSMEEINEFVAFAVEHRQYFEKILLYSVARNTAQAEGQYIQQFNINDFLPLTNLLDKNNLKYSVFP